MTSAAEAAAAKGPLAAPLQAGVDTLSQNQEITFVRYKKMILPADGFVFWVNAALIDPTNPLTTTVKGSLHFATDQAQREDETFGVNHVIFTASRQIDEFNEVSPDTMYLGEFSGLRFSFASRGSYYRQADQHHYRGDAVYPAFASQIIDDVNGFLNRDLVVSNSLPIWLGLNERMPVYPSFLVSDNITPPFASIHIPPEATTALASGATLGNTLTRAQLCSDRVRVTIYGLRNSQALDYLDYVIASMSNSDAMGLQNIPVVRDEKRTQNELTVLAMKKTIEFQVSYLQNTARTVARQLITSALCAVEIGA
jgi:hypothetical protein